MRAGGGTSGPLAITSREEEKRRDMAPAAQQCRLEVKGGYLYRSLSPLPCETLESCPAPEIATRGGKGKRTCSSSPGWRFAGGTWPSPALIRWPRSGEGSQPGTPFPLLLRWDRGWWPGKGGDDAS